MHENLMLLPPPVCHCRSGPSVVETGAKAHRATQRSSSPGNTSFPHPVPLSVFRSRARLRHLDVCYPALSRQEEEEEALFPRKQVTLSCDFGGRRCPWPPPSLLTPRCGVLLFHPCSSLFSERAAACNTFLDLSVRVESRENAETRVASFRIFSECSKGRILITFCPVLSLLPWCVQAC